VDKLATTIVHIYIHKILASAARFKKLYGHIKAAVGSAVLPLCSLQGATEKSGLLNFFAVFSTTVWDFNMKFYSFIY